MSSSFDLMPSRRPSRRTSTLTLVSLVACLLTCAVVDAKPGGGRGKGGGVGKALSKGPGSYKSKRPIYQRGPVRGEKGVAGQKGGDRTKLDRQTWNGKGTTGQHLVEERKLRQRRQVADHLREVSERNGNERLKEVADMMDRKALDHYEKRLRAIDGEAFDSEVVDELRRFESLDDAANLVDRLSDGEGLLNPRLRAEEGMLSRSFDTADRLRRLANLRGDRGLLDAADSLERSALDRYLERMSRVSGFVDRPGLVPLGVE